MLKPMTVMDIRDMFHMLADRVPGLDDMRESPRELSIRMKSTWAEDNGIEDTPTEWSSYFYNRAVQVHKAVEDGRLCPIQLMCVLGCAAKGERGKPDPDKDPTGELWLGELMKEAIERTGAKS